MFLKSHDCEKLYWYDGDRRLIDQFTTMNSFCRACGARSGYTYAQSGHPLHVLLIYYSVMLKKRHKLPLIIINLYNPYSFEFGRIRMEWNGITLLSRVIHQYIVFYYTWKNIYLLRLI